MGRRLVRSVPSGCAPSPPPSQMWLLYLCIYFSDRLRWLVPLTGRKRMVVALWGTALRTREAWARVSRQ